MIFAICDEATGEIDRFVRAPRHRAKLQLFEGQVLAINRGEPSFDRYRNRETGQLNKRPATPCTASRIEVPADGATHVTLSKMRPETRLEIAGPVSASFTAKQRSEQMTFVVPGTYTLTATAPWPALPKTMTIYAT